MTTNKKRPSDLAVWDGDLSANVHVHKPGASMKVSLQEIVDAVPAPEVLRSDIDALQAKDLEHDTAVAGLDGRVTTLETSGGSAALPGRFEIGSYVIGVAAVSTSLDTKPLEDSLSSNYYLVEGSGLRMASLNTYHPTANPQVGTWRQMSVATSGGTDYLARATIYMRIA